MLKYYSYFCGFSTKCCIRFWTYSVLKSQLDFLHPARCSKGEIVSATFSKNIIFTQFLVLETAPYCSQKWNDDSTLLIPHFPAFSEQRKSSVQTHKNLHMLTLIFFKVGKWPTRPIFMAYPQEVDIFVCIVIIQEPKMIYDKILATPLQ